MIVARSVEDTKRQQSGPVSRILSRGISPAVTAIYLGRWLPIGSSTLPAAWCETGRLAERRRPPRRIDTSPFSRRLRGLAGGGVYLAATVAGRAVRSYRTISPLPETSPARTPSIGGVFSVALSLASLPVAVSHHRALSSSDFPPGSARPPSDRLAHSAVGGIVVV